MLRPLVTATEGTDEMQALLSRARVLSAALAALAVLAAATFLWRASGNAWTALTFVGVVFAAGGVWWNGIGDVRPDTAALAVWWVGACLVAMAGKAWARGLGIGLVFLAAVIKPQWPLASIVVGVFFLATVLRDRRSFVVASGAAGLVAAAGLGATALLADLRIVYFHAISQTSAMIAEALPSGIVRPPLFGCPTMLRPPAIYLAAAIVIAAWLRNRRSFAKPSLVLLMLVIGAASLVEIFFVYPYPAVDFRFYAFWSIAGSAVLALVPVSVAALLPAGLARPAAWIPAAAAFVALLLSFDLIGAKRTGSEAYWQFAAMLERELLPGETIWNGVIRHPIDAHDASYYWFGMWEVMPVALRLASTEKGREFLPPMTESDLPPCRVMKRLDPNVRFMAEPLDVLPIAKACFEQLKSGGRLTRTAYPQLWRVLR
jgi:hypothetical protein